MDKLPLIEQMRTHLSQSLQTARTASEDAAVEAREGATPTERRLDTRVALEFSQMARAQDRRAARAQAELDQLDRFRPAIASQGKVAVGCVVEVEDEDSGEGRTFFLAPVGAGMTLTGPGGDGIITVATPASPVGRAVVGRRVGEVIDVVVEGQTREWVITYVG